MDFFNTYPSSLPYGLIAFVIVALFAFHKRTLGKKLPLPPSPKGLPIIGKTREALDPNKKIWSYLKEWKEETGAGQFDVSILVDQDYIRRAKLTGDIILVRTLGQNNLFISSAQAAQDLLEKKGHIYAARPVCDES